MEEKIGRKIFFVCEVASSLFESLVISLQKIFLPIFFTKFAFFTTSSEFTNKKNGSSTNSVGESNLTPN